MANGDNGSDCLLSTLLGGEDLDDDLGNDVGGNNRLTEITKDGSRKEIMKPAVNDSRVNQGELHTSQSRPKRKSLLISSQSGRDDEEDVELDGPTLIEPLETMTRAKIGATSRPLKPVINQSAPPAKRRRVTSPLSKAVLTHKPGNHRQQSESIGAEDRREITAVDDQGDENQAASGDESVSPETAKLLKLFVPRHKPTKPSKPISKVTKSASNTRTKRIAAPTEAGKTVALRRKKDYVEGAASDEPEDSEEGQPDEASTKRRFHTRMSTAPRGDAETSKLLVQLQEFALHSSKLLTQQDKEIRRLGALLEKAETNQERFCKFMNHTTKTLRALEKHKSNSSQPCTHKCAPRQPVTNNVVLHAGEIDSLSSSVADMYYRIANVESLKLNVDLLSRRMERIEPLTFQYAYGGSNNIPDLPAQGQMFGASRAPPRDKRRSEQTNDQSRREPVISQTKNRLIPQGLGENEAGDDGDISDDTNSLLDDPRRGNDESYDLISTDDDQSAHNDEAGELVRTGETTEEEDYASNVSHPPISHHPDSREPGPKAAGRRISSIVNYGKTSQRALLDGKNLQNVQHRSGARSREQENEQARPSQRVFLTPKPRRQTQEPQEAPHASSPITPYPRAGYFGGQYPQRQAPAKPSALRTNIEPSEVKKAPQVRRSRAISPHQRAASDVRQDERNASRGFRSRTQGHQKDDNYQNDSPDEVANIAVEEAVVSGAEEIAMPDADCEHIEKDAAHAQEISSIESGLADIFGTPKHIAAIEVLDPQSQDTPRSQSRHGSQMIRDSDEGPDEPMADTSHAQEGNELMENAQPQVEQVLADAEPSISTLQVVDSSESCPPTSTTAEQDVDTPSTSVGFGEQLDQALLESGAQPDQPLESKAAEDDTVVLEVAKQTVTSHNRPEQSAISQPTLKAAETSAETIVPTPDQPPNSSSTVDQPAANQSSLNLSQTKDKFSRTQALRQSQNALDSSADEGPRNPTPSIPGSDVRPRRTRRKTSNQNARYTENNVLGSKDSSDSFVPEAVQPPPPTLPSKEFGHQPHQSKPRRRQKKTTAPPIVLPANPQITALFTRTSSLSNPITFAPKAPASEYTSPYIPNVQTTSDSTTGLPTVTANASELLAALPNLKSSAVSTIGTLRPTAALPKNPSALPSSIANVAPAPSNLTVEQMQAELAIRARQAFLQDQEMRARLGLGPGSGSTNELFYKEMFWRRTVRLDEKRERQERVNKAWQEMSKRGPDDGDGTKGGTEIDDGDDI